MRVIKIGIIIITIIIKYMIFNKIGSLRTALNMRRRFVGEREKVKKESAQRTVLYPWPTLTTQIYLVFLYSIHKTWGTSTNLSNGRFVKPVFFLTQIHSYIRSYFGYTENNIRYRWPQNPIIDGVIREDWRFLWKSDTLTATSLK